MYFKLVKLGRPTVAERSKASVLRSWMRKVVGSNPGEGNRLSFVVSKDRMKGSNAICGLQFFEEQEVVRINLL